MEHKTFRIGTFSFELFYPEEFLLNENFRLFEAEDTVPEYFYSISLVDEIREPEENAKVRRNDLLVYSDGALESRVIGTPGDPVPYAYYRETDEFHACVEFVKDAVKDLRVDPLFVSLLALERRMVSHEGLIFHCAYLDKGNKEAILFSAPSGTGKSTQAGLWEKYRPGARQINGDKALLQKVDGVWMARSWPVCGSSEICRIQDTKIKAIVMLSQDKVNHCERLSPMQAFSLMYPQVTCNKWNKKSLMKTMDLIDDVIRCVPVWHLGCDISEDAVVCLEKALEEGNE